MVEFDIANVLRGIGGGELWGIRRSFLGFVFRFRFMWRIPGVGFKWNILLKDMYELGFEDIKGANML